MNRKSDALFNFIIMLFGMSLLALVGVGAGAWAIAAVWYFIPDGVLFTILKWFLSILFSAAVVLIILMVYRLFFFFRDDYREEVQKVRGGEE